jgi:SAM-dependent methyltransferase
MAAEQRASLASAHKKQAGFTFFSNRTLQYDYFNEQLGNPDWTGKSILDFGGNIGGFLVGAPSTVRPENYWCVDLHRPALERGRAALPGANFVFYNQYHNLYNPSGIVDLPVPELGGKFDIIIAFSVFTHTSVREMQELLAQLQALVKRGGLLAFTFEDPDYDPMKDPHYNVSVADSEVEWGSNLRHRLLREKPNYPGIDVEKFILRAVGARWCALVGDRFYADPDDASPVEQEPGAYYHQFHTTAFLRKLFREAEIYRPPSPLRQHCCILRGQPGLQV